MPLAPSSRPALPSPVLPPAPSPLPLPRLHPNPVSCKLGDRGRAFIIELDFIYGHFYCFVRAARAEELLGSLCHGQVTDRGAGKRGAERGDAPATAPGPRHAARMLCCKFSVPCPPLCPGTQRARIFCFPIMCRVNFPALMGSGLGFAQQRGAVTGVPAAALGTSLALKFPGCEACCFVEAEQNRLLNLMSKLICQAGAVLFPSAVQVLSASAAHLDMPVTVRLGIARPHQQGCNLARIWLLPHKDFFV